MTELLLREVASGLEGTELDLDFADYMEAPFVLTLYFEFRTDGTYRTYTNDEEMAGMVAPLQNAMKGFFTDVLFLTIRQELEQAGMDVSGLNSMSDAEAMLGMTVDEMMAQSGQGDGMDSFIESLFNLETVKDLAKDINTDGVYSVTGDTLLLDGDDEMTISFSDADTLVMDGDDGGAGLLPLTLQRVA